MKSFIVNCILLDPKNTSHLWPLTQTRPISDLRIGILCLQEKWKRYLNANTSHLCNSSIEKVFPIQIESDNVIISGNAIPDQSLVDKIKQLSHSSILVNSKNEIIVARLNQSETISFIENYKTDSLSQYLSTFNIYSIDNIKTLQHPWQIFQWNGEEIQKDFDLITKGRNSEPLDSSNQILGNNIFIEKNASIQCSILNTNTGPIYIGEGAEVMEGSIIRGPFALCDHASTKLGTKIYGPTTIGPQCKIGGEVNNTVFHSNSNKAHDGFIGNAVIGEWCNIGADSNNSNLKNTYAEVKLWNYATNNFARTGSIFCGLIMGDHAKCGINTMFNTGTVVGVGANVFGSGFPRQFIPDFAWGGASGFSTFKFKEFMETAKAVMSRRSQELSLEQIELLQKIYNETAGYRNWEGSN